jgi:hypothetical protein
MHNACIGLVPGILVCGLLVACQSDPKGQEDATEFTVAGTIVRVSPQHSYLLDIYIDELVFPETSPIIGLTGLVLHVYSDTQISVRESGELRDGNVDDLTVGAAIEARASTLLLLSARPQTRAFEVVVDRTQ